MSSNIKILPSYVSKPLKKLDRNDVIKYSCLYKVWGYRTGENGEHENFEKQTHEDITLDVDGKKITDSAVAFQFFSDMLFRNLQQVIEYNQNILFESDAIGKMEDNKSELNYLLGDDQKNKYIVYKHILEKFWKQPGVEVMMDELINDKSKKKSVKFLSCIAEILKLLKEGDKNGVIRQYNSYLNSF